MQLLPIPVDLRDLFVLLVQNTSKIAHKFLVHGTSLTEFEDFFDVLLELLNLFKRLDFKEERQRNCVALHLHSIEEFVAVVMEQHTFPTEYHQQ